MALLLGAFPKSYSDFHRIAIPKDGQGDSLADAGIAQQVSNQLVHGLDLVAVDSDDHIAAHRDSLSIDASFIGVAKQAGLSRGTAFNNLAHQGAFRVGIQVHCLSNFTPQGRSADAKIRVLEAAVLNQGGDHLIDCVGRDHEPDAGVGAGARLDGCGHTNHLTLVIEQHTAGVARVDRRIGLDDFAARLFGPFAQVDLPRMGFVLRQGEPGFGLVRGDLRAECLSPVEGVVVALNPKVSDQPDSLTAAPYDDGWLMVVEPVKLLIRLRNLFFEDESRVWLEDETERLTGMVAEDTGMQLAATGGRALPDIFGRMPELGWKRLTQTFLRT